MSINKKKGKTLKQLVAECKQSGIKGYSKYKKDELIAYMKSLNLAGASKKSKEAKSKEAKFKSPKSQLGIHVYKRNDIAAEIVNAAVVYGVKAVQIFTHNPRSGRRSKHNYADITKAVNNSSVNLYIHSAYVSNPWKGLTMKPNTSPTRTYDWTADKVPSFAHELDQFSVSQDLKSKGVVLHIPKIYPHHVAMGTFKLFEVLDKKKLLNSQKIILEMKAVKKHATMSYESPEKINNLVDELKKLGLSSNKIGICIDTAHIYAGQAVIGTYDQAKEYLGKLKYHDWICLIHLNGNEYDCKKRAGDKHAVPLDAKDKIWNGKKYEESGCRAFIEYCGEKGIDFILETKDHHTEKQISAFLNKAFLSESSLKETN